MLSILSYVSGPFESIIIFNEIRNTLLCDAFCSNKLILENLLGYIIDKEMQLSLGIIARGKCAPWILLLTWEKLGLIDKLHTFKNTSILKEFTKKISWHIYSVSPKTWKYLFIVYLSF